MRNSTVFARGLGWFSIALGLTEVIAGRELAKWMGTRSQTNVLRAYGLREIAVGVAILAETKPSSTWIWARVAGDVLDLATLGAALKAPLAQRENIAVAIGAVAGATALDVLCAVQLSREERLGLQPR